MGIFLVAAGFMIPALGLPVQSALLPIAMLVAIMILAIAMFAVDRRRAARGEIPKPVVRAPRRVAGAFALIAVYIAAVDLVGFYPSTALSVPLVAWIFGYRNVPRLAFGTAVTLGAIYLIFSLAMSQDFPGGRLWER
jgi:putative tricarboxylic transport membrane protein